MGLVIAVSGLVWSFEAYLIPETPKIGVGEVLSEHSVTLVY